MIFENRLPDKYVYFHMKFGCSALPTTPPPVSFCRTETFSESSFLIISPQFPRRYDPGQDCSYSIIRRSKVYTKKKLFRKARTVINFRDGITGFRLLVALLVPSFDKYESVRLISFI